MCVSEERGKPFMKVSCISSRVRILNCNFFINLEAFIDISFFLPTPFEKFPRLDHNAFQKNSARNPFIISCWWKIMVTSKT